MRKKTSVSISFKKVSLGDGSISKVDAIKRNDKVESREMRMDDSLPFHRGFTCREEASATDY